MQTVFGLDFGTTNSALAVNSQGNTEVINIFLYRIRSHSPLRSARNSLTPEFI